MSEDIEYFIKERIKNHSTGNSQFKIEQWFDNFDMKAVPAFFSKKDTWTNYIENTNYANYKEVERHTEAILELIKKENKKPPKFTFCYSELFGGSYDEMVNYFIPRSALEKSKKAIDKKINTI